MNEPVSEPVIPTDAQLEAARELLNTHIEAIEADYARTVAGLRKDVEQFTRGSRWSTYLMWALFWISGYLGRGFFEGTPMEMSAPVFFVGASVGACAFMTVYGAIWKWKGA